MYSTGVHVLYTYLLNYSTVHVHVLHVKTKGHCEGTHETSIPSRTLIIDRDNSIATHAHEGRERNKRPAYSLHLPLM
jgi:hypothetical protein